MMKSWFYLHNGGVAEEASQSREALRLCGGIAGFNLVTGFGKQESGLTASSVSRFNLKTTQ